MFISEIITETARQFYMTAEDITGKRRTKPITEARFALYKAMRVRGASMPQIARWVGQRDHTSILHGLRRADELSAADDVYREIVEHLIMWKRK